MDFSLSESERDLVGLCREFAQQEIAARAPLAWEEARCPTDLLREMGALGLLGMLIPEEWGGIGMSTVGFVAAMEQIGLADQSVAAAWQAHVTIGSLPLYLFGDDAQRERWLRPLAEGRVLGAFGLTEPDAGSDARGISTRAVRRDGGWLINGRKTFISNAGTDMSFGVTLLARTESAEGERPTFASFVVEKDTAGFTMGPKLRGIGWQGLDTRELFFDDVWVADDHLVGDPAMGLEPVPPHARGRAHLDRGLVAQPDPGRARPGAGLRARSACSSASRSRSSRRSSSSSPTSRPSSRRRGGSRTAPRHLRDAGQPFLKEASMAKLKASRLAVWAASEAVQIHGGLGYMLESPVARFYCDAKVLEIGEGTNEIQHLVIARALGC